MNLWIPRLWSLLFVIALSGCAHDPAGVSDRPVAPDEATQITVLLATTRDLMHVDPLYRIGTGPLPVQYAEYVISVPPLARSGRPETLRSASGPKNSFVIISSRPLSKAEFLSRAGGRGDRRTSRLVFIHGFNTPFQEGLFRTAQLAADARHDKTAILFSWPSAGSPFAYQGDRKAAAASSRGLAQTLEGLSAGHHPSLVLVAHSMGGWLTVETLAGFKPAARHSVLDRFSNIVLAAPDIDIADMMSRLQVIGRFRRPLTILVAKDDLALKLARLIEGGDRVGADDIRDPRVLAAARRFGGRVIDVSALESRDSFNHGRFSAVAAFYPKFRSQIEDRRSGNYAKPGVYQFDAATSSIRPVHN